MLTKGQFDVLNYFNTNQYTNQRAIKAALGYSLGKINSLLSDVRKNGWLSEQYSITPAGYEQLSPYKVDNAIIMAAGLSSRFAPLSYDKPKGLLVVKGEILIERQIRQLQEAGITDITVVIGYMKELFFYLKDKFNVNLVINEDYRRYNNPYTLLKVLDRLSNTYVCSSDDYFVDNVFEQYVYGAYYSSVYLEDASNEWGFIWNKQGRITGVDREPVSAWVMMGHVYFDKAFSETFRKILLANLNSPMVKNLVWEYLLAEHFDELNISIRKYGSKKLLEFDSLEDLRHFDDKYLQNTGSQIFKNICSVFDCCEADIQNISLIPQGFMNLSFKFSVNGSEYVYRHPGKGTQRLVSRRAEAFAEQYAKDSELDRTFVYMDSETGWKISKYIPNVRLLDIDDPEETETAFKMIKRLHDAKLKSPSDFDLWPRIESEIQLLKTNNCYSEEIDMLFSKMKTLNMYAETDNVEKILNHGDFYAPNVLIDEQGEYYLIDWEYSGNADPMNDITGFIICREYSDEDICRLLSYYYGRKPNEKEIRHTYAYLALEGFYWYLWAVHKETDGTELGEYTLRWYGYAVNYVDRTLELYK